MRTLLATFLVLLILLNIFGYYSIILGLIYTNDQAMASRLDAEDYQTYETMTLRIPLALPYASDSHGFTRIAGKFQHNGEFYHLAKQRLLGDTMIIVCVKDRQTKGLNAALTDCARSFTNDHSNLTGVTKAIAGFKNDYVLSLISLRQVAFGWSYELGSCAFLRSFFEISILILSPPPKVR